MKARKLFIGVATIFAVSFVVCVIVTYLWNLIVHGQSTVDWGLSFRLAIVLGVVLPATRGHVKQGKISCVSA